MDPWLFRRISVRYLAAGQASDVIGRVIHRTDLEVHLMRRDGQIEIVPVDDIIAARDVPDTERRLRTPTETPVEALDAMIARVSGPASGSDGPPLRVFVADLREVTDLASTQPAATVQQHPDDVAADPTLPDIHPELRMFVRTAGGATARAVLSGDWLTLDHLHLDPAGNHAETLHTLVSAASAWAQPRGAFFMWVLCEEGDDQLVAVLNALGCSEHHRRGES